MCENNGMFLMSLSRFVDVWFVVLVVEVVFMIGLL